MTHYDLVVIGTGSGNTIVNKRFADWKVAIVERGTFGGTCLNVGCIPTKMFVHTADLAATPAASAKLGVDAELRGVRWTDVRDRIFGRIDPIAASGREYRRSHADNAKVTVYDGTARFTGPRRLAVTGVAVAALAVAFAAHFAHVAFAVHLLVAVGVDSLDVGLDLIDDDGIGGSRRDDRDRPLARLDRLAALDHEMRAVGDGLVRRHRDGDRRGGGRDERRLHRRRDGGGRVRL